MIFKLADEQITWSGIPCANFFPCLLAVLSHACRFCFSVRMVSVDLTGIMRSLIDCAPASCRQGNYSLPLVPVKGITHYQSSGAITYSTRCCLSASVWSLQGLIIYCLSVLEGSNLHALHSADHKIKGFRPGQCYDLCSRLPPRLPTHFIIGTSGEAPIIVKCGTGYFCMSGLMRDCETETKYTCRVTLLGRNKASWWYYEGQQQAKL